MFVADMVQAIAQRLDETLGWAAAEPILDPATVSPFPDDPERYAMRDPVAEVLVSFGGSGFGEPEATDRLVQKRSVEFDLTLLTRSLNDRSGAYAYIEAIRLTLTGLRVAKGGTPLRPLQESFLSHRSGVWRYQLVYGASLPAIEVLDEEAPVLLRRITLSGPGGQSDIQSDTADPPEE